MKTVYVVTSGNHSADPHTVVLAYDKKSDALKMVAGLLDLNKFVTIMRAEDSAKSSPDRAYGAS